MSLVVDVVGEEAMVELGRIIGRALEQEAGALVFFNGGLGAGKTTLCRGILNAFGHAGAVKSPTYTLVEPYAFNDCTLYHFDLYRMADPEELEYMGIRDYLAAERNYCLVEWPERGTGVLPSPDLEIRISMAGRGRKLEMASFSPIGDNSCSYIDNCPAIALSGERKY